MTDVLPRDPGVERPMLSRVAGSLYWLGRYVERAEHVARLLLEGQGMMTDVSELAPGGGAAAREHSWRAAPRVFDAETAVPPGSSGRDIARFMTLDRSNPNSLAACLVRARENARGVRENISAEMFECLNTLYWTIQAAEAQMEESPQQLYTLVVVSSMMFQGIADQTLPDGQGLLFLHLGKHLERLDLTCRIIADQFTGPAVAPAGGAVAADRDWLNFHWMSLLRSCGALEGYRRAYPGELDAARVIAFLVLERSFPRSVGYGVLRAYEAVSRVRSSVAPRQVDRAERVLGRLDTQLAYAEAADVLAEGVGRYMEKIRAAATQAAGAVKAAYFLE